MLRSLRDLEKYTVGATDGDVGTVVNFLLDDERWVVRYLIVETGGFFESRRVLISPISFRQVVWSSHHFQLALTMDRVKNSPGVDTDKPVSRQHEQDYYRYYGYPYYWSGMGIWGVGTYPGILADGGWNDAERAQADTPLGDAHLRSAAELRGYDVQGSDEAIGHIDGFIIDDETWAVRYLVVDTSNWWFGKKALVAPHWATGVSWDQRKVHVNLPRQVIKDSPVWNPSAPVNRAYEARLYDYYGRPAYWTPEEVNAPSSAHP